MTTSQAYSRPARLLQIASWIIAIVFAGFLDMLGGLVIRDLMFVPHGGPPTAEQFVDTNASAPLDAQLREIERQRSALGDKGQTLSTGYDRASTEYRDAQDSLRNWLATRSATGDNRNDVELLSRTRKLDVLQANALNWQHQRDALVDQQRKLDSQSEAINAQLARLQADADARYAAADKRYELTVFGWRLALTLPVLIVAVWLFVRHRKSRYWPFIYGFGLFALSAFFVELVPYLPNFGGYVRVLVGIALTVFAGLYMLRAFQRYVERKRAEMQQSQSERARSVVYEKAISAYQKKLCPSCDKPWHLGGEQVSFCIHCGLRLFEICACGARNFAFFPFCNQCGAHVTKPSAPPADEPPAAARTEPPPI
ncbi:zinc ribbon domain-containing protein [Paraburkholderia bannensis]|uniref:zinc ribbon domain-containing protein n=1 Tax=Paraburkholderia bannensis TaxID=765414 RepID=UPI002ABDEBA0|nr:zinc ribbon domain-containing protein [Paraburkholderia bannensis]